ncbi:hypothetical protein CEXT_156931 [Caerostris extrusa]|uniref:Uncharacterized protein n=1 Tax=Caerostris extrusa TaxID=172846 RepID=A0AAV4NZ15_CAEEX|nr:hypothetical protein CEXT_156931 [Caerostris extrusa]
MWNDVSFDMQEGRDGDDDDDAGVFRRRSRSQAIKSNTENHNDNNSLTKSSITTISILDTATLKTKTKTQCVFASPNPSSAEARRRNGARKPNFSNSRTIRTKRCRNQKLHFDWMTTETPRRFFPDLPKKHSTQMWAPIKVTSTMTEHLIPLFPPLPFSGTLACQAKHRYR